ncbi:MAG TPA: PASTA domain-containing protein [Terriglobales bacterium]|nr:PASTA domain-containing protein [Terriglobales bacterium]
MKSFFRFALLALVLLVVALISALTAMRFAIHGREVAVPSVIGKTPAEGRSIAEQSGLQIAVERQYYSASVPEGRILSQLPPAGTEVRRGWQVRVAESLGPQRVEIPNILGQSERAAELNIRRRGLDLGTVAQMEMPGTAADLVLSQSPPPNASGVSAPKISLLVAEAEQPQAFVMPNFIGQPLGSVTLALQDAKLRIGTVTQAGQPTTPVISANTPSPPPVPVPLPSPASIVVSQNPAPGQKIVTGAAVDFEVKQ